MKFPLLFRQEYTIEASILKAQFTSGYLKRKSGPISRLAKEEIRAVAAADVSRAVF